MRLYSHQLQLPHGIAAINYGGSQSEELSFQVCQHIFFFNKLSFGNDPPPSITLLSSPTEKRGARVARGDWPQHVRVSDRRRERKSPQVTHEGHYPPQLCGGFATTTAGIQLHFSEHVCSLVFCPDLCFPLYSTLTVGSLHRLYMILVQVRPVET